ncbi:hypothetical protein C8J56DRAFT_1042172 [Mycena floridula]|nr:hypothetical protein C8J56DRAFT_1042172 [Mycena floridula]
MVSPNSSDSSSDSYFTSSLMSHHHSTHQSAADLADVIVAGPNKLPLVTEGTFNIEVILQAKNAMEDHFSSKSTKPEDQVKQIYGCFQGVLPRTWINANKENLNDKTLDDFFDAFKRQHLPTDRDVSIHRSIIALKQRSDEKFSDFSICVRTKNAFLVGSDHHHDDGAIISILENGMLVELADRVELADPPLVKTTLKIWEERVNNKRPANTSQTYPNQRPFATSSQNTNNNFSRTNSNTNTASSTASSSMNSSFPAHARTYTTASNKTHSVVYANGKFEPLTDHNKDNLNTWKGCRKCRQILVDHKADNCPNGFADLMTYHVLTDEYCEATKRRHDAKLKGKTRPVAAAVPASAHVSSDDEDKWSSSPLRGKGKTKAVAAVMQPSTDDDEYLSNSDDTVSNRFIPSVRVSHLVWHCEVSGPSTSFPIKTRALIDNGSHLVLIRPELAAEMGLERKKLRIPEHVDVALRNGEAVPTILSDYVSLKISSRDGQYSSRKVVAVIAPICVSH